MNYDLRDSDLATILAEASLVAAETNGVFGRLSGEQVNWKPGENEWSIGQCFDHLIVSNRPFEPIFEEIQAGRRRRRLWERVPLLPGVFGGLIIDTLRPDSGRKVKARPAFYPSSSHIDPAVIDLSRAAGPPAAPHGSQPRTRSRGDHDHVAGGSHHHVQPAGRLPHHRRARAEPLRSGDARHGGRRLPAVTGVMPDLLAAVA